MGLRGKEERMWSVLALIVLGVAGLWMYWSGRQAEAVVNERDLRARFHQCIRERAPERIDMLTKSRLRWRSSEDYWVMSSVHYGVGMCGTKKRFDEAYDFDRYNERTYRRDFKKSIEPRLREAFREKVKELDA